MNHQEILIAKEVLRKAGYHIDSLWHVQDVTDRFECDNDQAYELLTNVLDTSVDRVYEMIHHQAKYELNLNEKEND